jgi:hypothetical protein
LCSVLLGDEQVQSGVVQAGLGAYLAASAGILAVLAGLVGLVRPDPK